MLNKTAHCVSLLYGKIWKDKLVAAMNKKIKKENETCNANPEEEANKISEKANVISITANQLSVIAIIVSILFGALSFCASNRANEKAEKANELSEKNNNQMESDSLAAYQGIMVVNQNITVKKKAGFICPQTRDVKCLYAILLNDGKDNFDKTIEVFFLLKY